MTTTPGASLRYTALGLSEPAWLAGEAAVGVGEETCTSVAPLPSPANRTPIAAPAIPPTRAAARRIATMRLPRRLGIVTEDKPGSSSGDATRVNGRPDPPSCRRSAVGGRAAPRARDRPFGGWARARKPAEQWPRGLPR